MPILSSYLSPKIKHTSYKYLYLHNYSIFQNNKNILHVLGQHFTGKGITKCMCNKRFISKNNAFTKIVSIMIVSNCMLIFSQY